jgi:hypothetical protein
MSDLPRDWVDFGQAEKSAKKRCVSLSIASEVDALVNLSIRHHANTDAILQQPIDKETSSRVSSRIVYDPIAVNEIAHKSTGGRSPLSRSA